MRVYQFRHFGFSVQRGLTVKESFESPPAHREAGPAAVILAAGRRYCAGAEGCGAGADVDGAAAGAVWAGAAGAG